MRAAFIDHLTLTVRDLEAGRAFSAARCPRARQRSWFS